MATVTVRNLPDEVHRALRVRAASHSRSTEAEIRLILEQAVRPQERLRMGTALAELRHQVGLTDELITHIEQARQQTPAEPIKLE